MIKNILVRNRWLTAVCIIVFCAGMPLGYVLYDGTKDVFLPKLQELKDLIGNKDNPQMALAIFLNNYRVCVILVVAGMFILPTLFILFANGFTIGFIFKYILEKDRDTAFFLKGVLPHSVFELSAVIISAAIGLRIGLSFITLDNKKRALNVSRSIREAALIHFAVVLPLLLIAALVETYISAELIK